MDHWNNLLRRVAIVLYSLLLSLWIEEVKGLASYGPFDGKRREFSLVTLISNTWASPCYSREEGHFGWKFFSQKLL